MTSISTPKIGRRREQGLENFSHVGDSELARAACSDGAAFGELYRRYFNNVYGYHLLRTGNVQDAQDLTSQTFMAALEGIGRYDGRGSFAAWLMGIAHNKMAMYFRSRRPVTGLDAAENLPYPTLMLEELAHQRGLLRRVVQALREMTPDRVDAFVLRTFGGLSAAETAGLLGKSEAAVKMLVFRALQDIRRKFQNEHNPEDR